MRLKKGISLLLLIITLVVMSVITTAIVVGLNDNTKSAKIVSFAEELQNIKDAVSSYYLEYGEYPVVSGVVYTRAQILGMGGDQAKLEDEMLLNKDNSATYYKIDLTKFSLGESLLGKGEKANDFYVLSSDGKYVYYPLGLKVGDEVFFSITSKISKITHEDYLAPESSINSTSTTAKIMVSKSTNSWTNSLDLTVNTTIKTGEVLYYSIGGVEKSVTQTLPYTLTLSSATLTSAQLNALGTDSNIYFTKKSGGRVVASVTVGLQNLDTTSPSIPTAPVVLHYDKYNVVKFADAIDVGSGIKSSYFVTSTGAITGESIVSTGNKGDKYSIRLEKSVTSVKMVLVDNAGNISNVISVTI